jgi:hypothetical protein
VRFVSLQFQGIIFYAGLNLDFLLYVTGGWMFGVINFCWTWFIFVYVPEYPYFYDSVIYENMCSSLGSMLLARGWKKTMYENWGVSFR